MFSNKMLLAAWLGLALLLQAGIVSTPDIDKIEVAKQKALNQISQGASSLRVITANSVIQKDTGYEAYLVKVLDERANTIQTFWYDRDLNPISQQTAFEQQAASYQRRYGRLSKDLYAWVSQSLAGNIPVAIWAEQTATPVNANLPPAGNNRIFLPSVKKAGPMDYIVSFLAQRGYQPDYLSTEAPVVFAVLPASLISELQAQVYVAAIYEQGVTQKNMQSAARTAAAPWTWSRGIIGSGIKVAVIEDDGVSPDNPYLNVIGFFDSANKRVDRHATNVAGVIASTHSTERGIAYGAQILSANAHAGREAEIIEATDWAIESGADILNASIGTECLGRDMISLDKYFDWVVWNKRKTVTASAGNFVTCTDNNYNVSSPGKAYNVITVGSKNDQNTAQSEADVKDDVFSNFSLYVDPTTASENRLKPEVVATGERIISVSTTAPWIETSETQGTSFSAPLVAGEAALMMQRASWLKTFPEAVKAGIMTSARWTKLHDDQNYAQMTSIEKMGVGAVDVTAADNSLINNRIRGLSLTMFDFVNNYYDVPMDGCFAGERLRVVITWPAHPSRLIFNWILLDRLETDFDLTVQSPSGQLYTSSANEANYEIVELIMPEAGQYKARIHLNRWDYFWVTEKIGFAYYCGTPLD
jgi:subtilisin family serine protease